MQLTASYFQIAGIDRRLFKGFRHLLSPPSHRMGRRLQIAPEIYYAEK
ncbi:MAG: hypothetical protein RR049_00595 [Angelakisella sp.]